MLVAVTNALLCHSATSCTSVIEECQSSQSDSIKRRDLQKRQILDAHNAQGSERGSRRILRLSDHTLTASDPLLHSVVVDVVDVVVVVLAGTVAAAAATCKFVLVLSMYVI